MENSIALPSHCRRLTALDEARREATAGPRLEALRAGAIALRDALLGGGKARSVRTFDLVTFPYPTRFALGGVAGAPRPYVMMTNRAQLVTFQTSEGLKRLLVNPSDYEANQETPFFKRLAVRYGETLSRRVLTRRRPEVPARLAEAGIAPEAIDYVTFDHLHTQDVRRLLSTWAPRAKLLVHAAELALARALHPLQRDWYCPSGLDGVAADRVIPFDGDVLLGEGVALVWTPGHTAGNHTIVLHTDRGLWTISENGVCADAYSPRASHIAGLASHAAEAGVEVILNANTREGTLDQYNAMVLERTLASPVPEAPAFVQHFPSSELTPHLLAPGLAPTYTHGAITHGPEPAAVR